MKTVSDWITITVDGVRVPAKPGQTILEAADNAGIYIPRLCHRPGLEPYGGCRVCTVTVSGRPCSACTQPVAPDMVVENDTEELREQRRMLIEMLFVEGNHFCMFCEKSGNCELQALGYRFGVTAPRFDFFFPKREVDASHPDIIVDHNRCILCAGCVRASRDVDGKNVFQFVERGPDRRVAVNAEARLADTDADVTDKALDVCPVGALMRKREGFRTPIGERLYDHAPIGSTPSSEDA
ncbi:MAG: 2Fe-2S iron-sulfur cluster binding domain-containing protein [Planctomycetes bacterium]|nr:2Fe-2S iron-sulfur cluster binding domain-containing protein [Planctomycetota bacterium]